MKLAKIILKIFGVVLCSSSPALAQPSTHSDKVVDNNYTGNIEFGEDFNAKGLISPASRNFLSPKHSLSAQTHGNKIINATEALSSSN